MATPEFLNRIAHCLGKRQAERNDHMMSRRQHHAEQALFKAWLRDAPASFDDFAYETAKKAIQHYVRSNAGQGLLRRISTTRFIQMHLNDDGSEPWEWLHDAIEAVCDPILQAEHLERPALLCECGLPNSHNGPCADCQLHGDEELAPAHTQPAAP